MGLRNKFCLGLAHGVYAAGRLPVFKNLRWLQESEAWTPAQREQWKTDKLARIIDFAWQQVPFYREWWGDHGLSRRPLKHLEELQSYPVLRKDLFRANYQKIRPKNLKSISYQPKHSGGTTGQPMHYFQDLEQWSVMQAFHLYGWSFTGYQFGDPVGVIAGGSLVPGRMTLKGWVRNLMDRRLFLFGMHMDKPLAIEYHRKLEEFRTEFLYGYPSVIYLFSKFLTEEGLKLPRLRAVVTTAEMLQPRYRQGIESALGCPVFNNLGCNDGGYEAYECKFHRGLHYNDLQSILEARNHGSDLPGELLITNLWNRSTPFIRYAVGDLITMSNSPCRCGSRFPLITSVEGRTADILTFRNGRSLSGPALTLIFGDMEIDGWQIVQTAVDGLEVHLMTSGEIRPEYRLEIEKVLRFHVGEDVQIKIKRVDQLTKTQAGKLKPIWNNMETPAKSSTQSQLVSNG
jgi:phenylacetate-CoA ligase